MMQNLMNNTQNSCQQITKPNIEKQSQKKIPTTFQHFRQYCNILSQILNEQTGYYCSYKKLIHPLLREHDAQYLLIEHKSNTHVIKINILYSLAYQIPIFYFMVYDMDTQKHLSAEELQKVYRKVGSGSVLSPENMETGIYISQNPLTKQYMYTLHSCELGMEIQFLVPFYLNLLELYPIIVLPTQYAQKYKKDCISSIKQTQIK